jgi:hypothetical protein
MRVSLAFGISTRRSGVDAASLSTSMLLSSVGGQVNIGVLKAVQNLDKTLTAQMFASIGLGGAVDTSA